MSRRVTFNSARVMKSYGSSGEAVKYATRCRKGYGVSDTVR